MTDERPWTDLTSTVLGAPDARELARFYCGLLGYEIRTNESDWVTIGPPGGGTRLSFQTEEHHVRPVWPGGPGDQQMQLHLDIEVRDLHAAGEHARALGATLAEFQPQKDVRVWLDPAGHPFCLWISE
jgi:catechol 2,3-dioxygenase-like lactoylglutathione lyase family enzyme